MASKNVTFLSGLIEREVQSLICSGSPVTNEVAQRYVPAVTANNPGSFLSPLSINPNALTYHFARGNKKQVSVYSLMEPSKKPRDKLDHAVAVHGRLHRPGRFSK
jgi:hypothetical protein